MTPLDMQPLQASFATQDQAESVIRKLASLRGDRFRLERAGVSGNALTSLAGATSSDSDSGDLSMSARSDSRLEASEELTPTKQNSVAEFTLSANVPGNATDQARTVILQAGGVIL
jgi:hypothetical protein